MAATNSSDLTPPAVLTPEQEHARAKKNAIEEMEKRNAPKPQKPPEPPETHKAPVGPKKGVR